MQWFNVPEVPPSKTFPIGTKLRDQKALYKILGEPIISRTQPNIHRYKVEILERYIPAPKDLLDWKARREPSSIDWEWLLVVDHCLPNLHEVS
jgi:hypothetical protein